MRTRQSYEYSRSIGKKFSTLQGKREANDKNHQIKKRSHEVHNSQRNRMQESILDKITVERSSQYEKSIQTKSTGNMLKKIEADNIITSKT